MSKDKFYALVDSFPEVVSKIKGKKFDSHEFIGMLIKHDPTAYIETLFFEYRKKKNPFQRLHSDLAKALAKKPGLAAKKGKKASSKNIHFLVTAVERWEKS